MTIQIPEGFSRVAYRFSLSGDPEVMITTMGYETAVVGQAVAEAFATTFQDAFPPAEYSASYTFLGVRMEAGADGGPPVIYEAVRTAVGTAASAPLTQNVAILVRKTSLLGGRRGRGRMFLPPMFLPEGEVSANGMINVGPLAAVQNSVTQAFFTDLDPVLLHDNVPSILAPTPITNVIVQAQVATQRRRLR